MMRFFIDFSKKKRKIEKHKKYVLICKLQCFVRVAMLEKARESLRKISEIRMEISSKIDSKCC